CQANVGESLSARVDSGPALEPSRVCPYDHPSAGVAGRLGATSSDPVSFSTRGIRRLEGEAWKSEQPSDTTRSLPSSGKGAWASCTKLVTPVSIARSRSRYFLPS